MKNTILLSFALVYLVSCKSDIQKSIAEKPVEIVTTQPALKKTEPAGTETRIAEEHMIEDGDAIQKIEPSTHFESVPTDDDRPASMAEGKEYSMSLGKADPSSKSMGSTRISTAGKLTAGELNDFQKWKMWEDLSETELKTYRETWKISMQDRYCVMVRNRSGFPVIDAKCTLFGPNSETLWVGHTDNTGKAELWGALQAQSIKPTGLRIKVESDGSTEYIDKAKPFSKGVNHVKMRLSCDTKSQVDIVFAVDATGSMGDEIHYLQDELLDVLTKIKSKHSVSLHTGSVFYRDHGDEYVTRASGLTSDMSTTTNFIKAQSAGGGGDGPEAVDDALIASIDQMNWRKSARARILFLILDAPPHSAQEHRERLQKAMVNAAAKGVRIVPLVASGGGYEMDKSMEYLMRSLAIATNGTYVFLTNHSGIGNHHTAPSTDSYEVETLNKILLRIVDQYVSAPGCDQDDWEEITQTVDQTHIVVKPTPDQSELIKEITLDCYPNPADNELYLKASHEMSDVYVSDNSGKLLEKLNLVAGNNRLDTSQYPSGVYYIKVLVEKKWLSKKFIVLHI